MNIVGLWVKRLSVHSLRRPSDFHHRNSRACVINTGIWVCTAINFQHLGQTHPEDWPGPIPTQRRFHFVRRAYPSSVLSGATCMTYTSFPVSGKMILPLKCPIAKKNLHCRPVSCSIHFLRGIRSDDAPLDIPARSLAKLSFSAFSSKGGPDIHCIRSDRRSLGPVCVNQNYPQNLFSRSGEDEGLALAATRRSPRHFVDIAFNVLKEMVSGIVSGISSDSLNLTYLVTFCPPFFDISRDIFVDIFAVFLAYILTYLLPLFLTFLLTFLVPYLLTFWLVDLPTFSTDLFSGIFYDNRSGTFLLILSADFFPTCFLTYLLASFFDISFGSLSDIHCAHSGIKSRGTSRSKNKGPSWVQPGNVGITPVV